MGALNGLTGCVKAPKGVVIVMVLALREAIDSSTRNPGGKNMLNPSIRCGWP